MSTSMLGINNPPFCLSPKPPTTTSNLLISVVLSSSTRIFKRIWINNPNLFDWRFRILCHLWFAHVTLHDTRNGSKNQHHLPQMLLGVSLSSRNICHIFRLLGVHRSFLKSAAQAEIPLLAVVLIIRATTIWARSVLYTLVDIGPKWGSEYRICGLLLEKY